ncbi:hypothetical protein PR002_g32361 [Phytophthora rubi]|uniref:Uncharacterized protein n=1 Tax=Phytophthora rubi TaxID=129364 RepID=A0A6A3GAM0_9STRA|nr:hypothetical protein PR002_g32361 [Phytophthora rubi]
MPVRWLIDARTESRSNGGRATWIDDTEGAPEGASEGLIDARKASRSNEGRATWIDDTEGLPEGAPPEGASEAASEGASEGARVMGAHAAGPAKATDSVLEGRSSAWGRAARAPRRADGSPPSEQAVSARALAFAAASTVDGVGDPAGATGAEV